MPIEAYPEADFQHIAVAKWLGKSCLHHLDPRLIAHISPRAGLLGVALCFTAFTLFPLRTAIPELCAADRAEVTALPLDYNDLPKGFAEAARTASRCCRLPLRP